MGESDSRDGGDSEGRLQDSQEDERVRHSDVIPDGRRKCTQCRLVLPLKEFTKDRKECRVCRAKAWMEYRSTERGSKVLMLTRARRRAKDSNIDINIDIEDFDIPDECPALNIPLEVGGSRRSNSPSLDRIDYAKGYVKGNVIVISELANRLKSNASSGQLREVADWMEKLGQ